MSENEGPLLTPPEPGPKEKDPNGLTILAHPAHPVVPEETRNRRCPDAYAPQRRHRAPPQRVPRLHVPVYAFPSTLSFFTLAAMVPLGESAEDHSVPPPLSWAAGKGLASNPRTTFVREDAVRRRRQLPPLFWRPLAHNSFLVTPTILCRMACAEWMS